MKKIAILGAGITGLAAADRLLELGFRRVAVIEARPHVGGLAATIRRNGLASDLGPHRLHTELPEAREVWSALAGGRLFTVRRRSRMLLAGRWIDYPLRPFQLLRVLGFGRMLRIASSLGRAKLEAPFRRGRPANFEQAMRRAFGRAAYRLVFEPYTRKIWRAEPAELSAEIARLRLPEPGLAASLGRLFRQGSRGAPLRHFQYVRGGIGGIADAFAERIRKRSGRIILGARVSAIDFGMTGATAVDIDEGGKHAAVDADVVISTLPIGDLGAMLPGGSIESRTALGNLEYLALILVFFDLQKERVGREHWLYFPEEPPRATRASEPKNFDPSMAPTERTGLCCEITCRRSEGVWEEEDGRIIDRTIAEMSAIGLFVPSEVRNAFVIREPYGYPVYKVGFEKSLEVLWPHLARFPNLITVGRQGLYNHNNIDHCIVMGRRAAETVAQSNRPALEWYPKLSRFSDFRIVD